MNGYKKTVISIAIISIAAALYFFLTQQKPASQTNALKPTQNQEYVTPSTSATSVIQTPQIRKFTLATSDSAALELIRQYQSATDKRKFYDFARQQPEAGGAFLAFKVANECMMWVSTKNSNAQQMQKWIGEIPKDSPNAAEHAAAIKKLLEPCLGFDKAPISIKEVADMAKAARSIDPVLKIKQSISEKYDVNGDLSGISTVISNAVKSGNPYAIQTALETIGAGTTNYNLFSNIVGGNELSPLDAKAFINATTLAACQFGVDCSPESWPALSLCPAGNCNLNLYQQIQSTMTPQEYANVMKYHTLIVDAFYKGDFDVIRVERRKFKK